MAPDVVLRQASAYARAQDWLQCCAVMSAAAMFAAAHCIKDCRHQIEISLKDHAT
jgi:hypothetical protein